MKKVAIIGVGLMGGSLGISLKNVVKNNKRQYYVIGIGRHVNSLQLAKDKNAIDEFSTDLKSVSKADIVIVCSPVNTIPNIFTKIISYIKPNCIVSDIGSTKNNIIEQISQICKQNKKQINYVSCHPMAGIEQNGVEFASGDIYNGATVVVTCNKITKEVKAISNMWKNIDCKCLFMSAKEHDELVAFSSHFPHVIAFNFYKMFKEKKSKNKNLEKLIAGSFNSITRVAKSSSQMWIPIFLNNKDNLKLIVKEFCKQLNIFVDCLDNEKNLKAILMKSINNENK